MKILSLGLYLDKFSIVFQNFDFWPLYGLFLGIFWRFSGIFCPSTQEHNIWKILSLGLYLDTFSIVFQIFIATGHTFWPRIFVVENMYINVSRNIVWNCHFWSYWGGGFGIWTFMARDFCGRGGLPQLGVVLVLVSCCFFAWT